MLDKPSLIPLKVVPNDKGNIYHILQVPNSDVGIVQEVYASEILFGCVKGWKRHLRVSLNLVVITGAIRFHLIDDRDNADMPLQYVYELGPDTNHSRLMIPPKIWVAFEAIDRDSILVNSISELHSPDESENAPLSRFSLLGASGCS